MKLIPIKDIKANPNNPRIIKDDKFAKLVQSLKDLPEMATVRPIVVNGDMVVLGGNMRLKAMKKAGWKEAPVEVVDWDEDKQRQFIIKDNVGYGDWDWDMIANEWDTKDLQDWGMSVLSAFAESEQVVDPKVTSDDIKKSKLLAIAIIAYDDISDLDKITDVYNLDAITLTPEMKESIVNSGKGYVFK